MQDVLDLYDAAPDPARPLVCRDPVQLIGEVREPLSVQPGQRERCNYGTAATAPSISS